MILASRRRLIAWCLAGLFWLRTSNSLAARLLVEETGAIGDLVTKYVASSNLTVTNLHSLATSSAWTAGWESALIDNTSVGYQDYAITAKIVVAAAGLSAGEIRMYLVAMLDDSTWPDVFDGTESGEAATDTEMRDAICKPAASTTTDTTASDTYYLHCPSSAAVFNGAQPAKFVIFITHSTGANLAAAGNQVTVKGTYTNVAQS